MTGTAGTGWSATPRSAKSLLGRSTARSDPFGWLLRTPLAGASAPFAHTVQRPSHHSPCRWGDAPPGREQLSNNDICRFRRTPQHRRHVPVACCRSSSGVVTPARRPENYGVADSGAVQSGDRLVDRPDDLRCRCRPEGFGAIEDDGKEWLLVRQCRWVWWSPAGDWDGPPVDPSHRRRLRPAPSGRWPAPRSLQHQGQ